MDEEDEIPILVEIDVTSKRIPVSILTGFLGSGKTTLLNFLLRNQHGKRIAIIENEFSSGLGIENMIAKSGIDGNNIAGFFELSNGCICCSVKDDLLATLEQLVLHKDRFDYVLIETTGVANPGPIIASLWADDGADSTLKLDGVVTVVDCVNIIQYLNSSDTSEDVRVQIALADRILLNKIDLISSDSQLQEIESVIKSINSSAELIRTSFSSVDPSWVLDINSYSLRNIQPFLVSNPTPQSCQDSDCHDPSCHDHHHENHDHDQNQNQNQNQSAHIANTLTTHGFTFTGFVNISALTLLLDKLLYSFTNTTTTNNSNNSMRQSTNTTSQTTYGRIYRMKGIFHVLNENYLYIMQAVHDVFDIQPSSFERNDNINEDPTKGQNSVIIIGKDLNKEYLESEIRKCLIHN